jgi:integrase
LNRWIDYRRARGIRARTLESYSGYIRREIAPVLGSIELARIKPGHVRWLLSLMKKKGLSAATITEARGVLRSALRQAVEEGLIPVNPVSAVKGPKVRRPELHWRPQPS